MKNSYKVTAYGWIDADSIEEAEKIYCETTGWVDSHDIELDADNQEIKFDSSNVIVCDCGEPMLPNLSTDDGNGMAWNCTNFSCRDFTGGEIEAEDLIACGVPEWVAHRIEALSDALLEIGMTR